MRPLKYKAYIKEYDKVVSVDRLGLNWDGSVSGNHSIRKRARR